MYKIWHFSGIFRAPKKHWWPKATPSEAGSISLSQLRLTCVLREEMGFVLLKFIERSLEWEAFLPNSLKTAGEL